MSIMTQMLERMRNSRMTLVLLGLVVVLMLVALFFLAQKLFFSPEPENTVTPNETGASVQANPSSELDALAGTLPRYSDEELERQYRELDAEKNALQAE